MWQVTRIHHLNCASFGSSMARLAGFPDMVSHVLLVEGSDGLILVDSGFGTGEIAGRSGKVYPWAIGARMDPAEPAITQLQAMGLEPSDVTDIVLTHLDFDHAGGISDFPQATIHVSSDEHAAAMAPKLPREHLVYKAVQWAHDPKWELHTPGGDEWLGFESAHVIGDDVVMIPLRGHTKGHSGVAVRRPSGGWFLHAGDSYFSAGEIETPPKCPPGLRAFQTALQVDSKARHHNQDRLRSLHAEHGPDSGASEIVTIFSAHAGSEFVALASTTD